jgi:hypothetical protein
MLVIIKNEANKEQIQVTHGAGRLHIRLLPTKLISTSTPVSLQFP